MDVVPVQTFPAHRGGRAFTLLELLVCISIIVLLVALLMPGLAKAREAARNSTCKSNLHQQGVALESYHVDQRTLPIDMGLSEANTFGNYADDGWDPVTNTWDAASVLPHNANSAATASFNRQYAAAGNDQPWFWFAWDYVGRDNRILQCPSEVENVGLWNIAEWELTYKPYGQANNWPAPQELHWPLQAHAYAYNRLLSGRNSQILYGINAQVGTTYPKLQAMPVSSIPKPSYTLLMADGYRRDMGVPIDYQRLLARHGARPRYNNLVYKSQGDGTYNALHLDGHVSAYSKWALAPTDANHPIRQPDRIYPGKTFWLRNGVRSVASEAASNTVVYFPGRP